VGASSRTSSIVEYSDVTVVCGFGRVPADVGPGVVRCILAATGEPCRGQSFKSARYSSLFLLRPVPIFTTRSSEGLLSRFMLSVRSMISTSEPDPGSSHLSLTGVCGTDSALVADCIVCFHLLAGIAVLAKWLSSCEPGPMETSRGFAAEPGAVLSLAISGSRSVVGRTWISGSSGTSVVASLMSSSKAPSGMSSMFSMGVASIGPNGVAGGSATSGGSEAFVESSQRRWRSKLCRVIGAVHGYIVHALQVECAVLRVVVAVLRRRDGC
jgi:hypothetical protein